jgi:hypothetical protein
MVGQVRERRATLPRHLSTVRRPRREGGYEGIYVATYSLEGCGVISVVLARPTQAALLGHLSRQDQAF